MEIRTAILKAADWIQANPKKFIYDTCESPTACGAPGCALGWIDFFAGTAISAYQDLDERAIRLLGVAYWDDGDGAANFENRMSGLNSRWKRSGKVCAATLRLYADKYHPAAALDPAFVAFREKLDAPAEIVRT